MGVVGVVTMGIGSPWVGLQRRLLGASSRYVSVRGKGMKRAPLKMGAWRWVALAVVLAWFTASVLTPLAGVFLRAFVTNWGEGVNLTEGLTLDHFKELFDYPNLIRGVVNTLVIGVFGGAASVAGY